MNGLLVLTSTMGCEVGVGAFAKLGRSVTVTQMTPRDASDRDKVFNQIREHCLNNYTKFTGLTVLMIGTYWSKTLYSIVDAMSSLDMGTPRIVIYCFGSKPEQIDDPKNTTTTFDFEWIVQDQDPQKWQGPMKFLSKFLPDLGYTGKVYDYYFKSFEPAIRLIDDRLNNKNINETQAFQNGIEAIGNAEEGLFSKFNKFFEGHVSLDKVMEIGRSISDYQTMTVQNRVLNNTKQITTKSGMKVVITEAPELCNLTHKGLADKYPEATMTTTLNLKLGKTMNDEDEFCFSFRSYDSGVDSSVFAKKLPQGDGSKTSSGGRAPAKIPYPFDL